MRNTRASRFATELVGSSLEVVVEYYGEQIGGYYGEQIGGMSAPMLVDGPD